MFAGIVETTGRVKKSVRSGGQVTFTFQPKSPFKKLELGASVAVNGVCLTVIQKTASTFSMNAVKETLSATNLGDLEQGNLVNLERALKMGDEIGGHFVTGHVDGLGKIKSIRRNRKNVTFAISAPQNIMDCVAEKGSVTCDGISLTVQSVKAKSFTLAIIPHTLEVTNLHLKKVGDTLNLEIDVLFRYLKRMFDNLPEKGHNNRSQKAMLKHLVKQGF